MSNLYKQRYIVTDYNQCRIINSNEILNAKLEELVQSVPQEEGFVEGIEVEQVQLDETAEIEITKSPEEYLEEVKQEASIIIQGTNQQVEHLLAEARKQAEEIKREAWETGQQQGLKVGRQEAQQEFEEQRKQLEEQRKLLEQEYQNKCQEMEPQLVGTICDVIKKVFPIQFDNTEEIILYLVRNTMLKIGSTKEFRVRVGEENYQYIDSKREELISRVGHDIQVAVEVDASMDNEQCIIETDSGFFNCGIDVQLDNLTKAIRSMSV